VADGYIHTVYKSDEWINEVEGGGAFGGAHATKEAAVEAGRARARADKTECRPGVAPAGCTANAGQRRSRTPAPAPIPATARKIATGSCQLALAFTSYTTVERSLLFPK
jgi:hypothetical protein